MTFSKDFESSIFNQPHLSQHGSKVQAICSFSNLIFYALEKPLKTHINVNAKRIKMVSIDPQNTLWGPLHFDSCKSETENDPEEIFQVNRKIAWVSALKNVYPSYSCEKITL